MAAPGAGRASRLCRHFSSLLSRACDRFARCAGIPHASSSPPVSAPATRRLGVIITLVTVLFIAAATLYPADATELDTTAICIVCGELGGTDVVLNVLLFLPVGFGLRLAGFRRRSAIAIVLAGTGLIEAAQFRLVPYRDASLGDLVMNSAGGLLGLWLGGIWRGLLLPERRLAQRLATASLALWIGVLALTAWAMRPDRAPLAPFRWALVPVLPGEPVFTGQLLDVRLHGRPIRTDAATILAALALDSLRLEATVVTGPAGWGSPTIVRLEDAHERPLFALGQAECGLLGRATLNARHLRVRPPAPVLSDVFSCRDTPRRAGDTLVLTLDRVPGELRVAARGLRDPPTATRTRTLALTQTLGWSMLLPWGKAPAAWILVWLSALWIAGLMLPVAWWAGHAGGARWLLLLLTAAALGLGLAPRLAGSSAPHPVEWAATFAAAFAGWRLGRRVSARRRPVVVETGAATRTVRSSALAVDSA